VFSWHFSLIIKIFYTSPPIAPSLGAFFVVLSKLIYIPLHKGTYMGTQLTVADVRLAMPKKKNFVTQEAVDIINASMDDPEFQGESLLQTASTYESVLKNARASVPEYLNAIRFCAYLMTNESNYTEAYKKTFREREFVQSRLMLPTDSPKYTELTSAASRYRRTKLVVDILTASQVPLDLIFTGYRYKAIGVLAAVMENGRYDRDRVSAAKELLAATKGADNIKIELDVGVTESSAVEQLNNQLAEIAAKQLQLLQGGAATLGEFGAMKIKSDEIIEGEVVND
jgi:hypothetical protein